MKWTVLVLLMALLSAAAQQTEKKLVKRSYVCPPNFVRLSHRCYFFSREKATWQDAYFQCRDLHSNLAIIRNANQDKLIRRTLSKKTLAPLERWLGGLYDWEQMRWKWAASGKPLVYQGFSRMESEDKEKLRWHCIIIDPRLQFKWNTRSCVEEKHFICHTKIKTVTNKGKKKLLRQYHVDKYNQLNEIPVPILPEDRNSTGLKQNVPNSYDPRTQFGKRPKDRKKRRKYRKRHGPETYKYNSNTTIPIQHDDQQVLMTRRKKSRADNEIDQMKWSTYEKESRLNPLYPKQIVEEFN